MKVAAPELRALMTCQHGRPVNHCQHTGELKKADIEPSLATHHLAVNGSSDLYTPVFET